MFNVSLQFKLHEIRVLITMCFFWKSLFKELCYMFDPCLSSVCHFKGRFKITKSIFQTIKSSEHNWFKVSVQRKDGGQITFPDEDYECCKTTCLFVKKGSNWFIAEYGAFGTDIWWAGIGN